MEISAQLVKQLRERTGAGMMECKKALVEAKGDLGEAEVVLRKAGIASAAKKSTRLWDANAVQKVDDFTVKLNGKVANLGIPEALFHYPLMIMDPAENGEFKVGSNGTGAFDMVELDVGKRARFVARKTPHWSGVGPYLDAFGLRRHG